MNEETTMEQESKVKIGTWVFYTALFLTVAGMITVTTVNVGGMEISVTLGMAIGHFATMLFQSIGSFVLYGGYLIVGIIVSIALWNFEPFRRMLNRAMITAVWLFFGILGAAIYFIISPFDPSPLPLQLAHGSFAIAGLFFIWREILGFLDKREEKKASDSK